MNRRIDGILFDLGNTLLHFGKVDTRTVFEAGAHLAYEYLAAKGWNMPSFARYHRKQLWSIRWNVLISRITQREFDTVDLLMRLGRRMGHELTRQQAEELAWLWYKPLSEQAWVDEGVRELLNEFHQAGLKLGIVSNTFIPGHVLDRHLEQEGLLELLPTRVYSCDVRYRKPHPRIFKAALQHAGLKPQRTMFVGDTLRADIHGANRMRMISVLRDPEGRHARSRIRPRHRIADLAELRVVVGGYNAPASEGVG